MRSRILLIISAVLVFGLGIVVYAYNTPDIEPSVAACCCCTDSCPMNKGDKAAAAKTAASADHKAGSGHSCCGDSCPMKKGEKSADGKAHGDSCCGDSCPMKGKAAGHEGMKHDAGADGRSCPMMEKGKDGMAAHAAGDKMAGDSCCCACCNKEKAEKKADAAV
jgi:hypothetical protein